MPAPKCAPATATANSVLVEHSKFLVTGSGQLVWVFEL